MNQVLIELLGLFNALIGIYMWIVIIAALLTFVRPDPFNPIVQFLYRMTNPTYAMIRRFIPTIFNGIDLAPLIIIVTLQVVQIFVRAIQHAL